MIDPAAETSPPPYRGWRLKYGDQVFGPYDRAELEALRKEGRLDRDSLLAEEGQHEDWRRAGDIPELANMFERLPPPARAKPPKVRAAGSPDTSYLHLIYALYVAELFTVLTGVVGVVIAYVKRSEAIGTWQASHYEWQIRTFWWGALFLVVGFVTQLIGIGFVILFLGGIWFLYRIIKGWLRLSQLRAVEDPTAFF